MMSTTETPPKSETARCPLCDSPLLESPDACSKCDWVKGYCATATTGTNPVDLTACLLSIVPGAGHYYKGHKKMGWLYGAGAFAGHLLVLPRGDRDDGAGPRSCFPSIGRGSRPTLIGSTIWRRPSTRGQVRLTSPHNFPCGVRGSPLWFAPYVKRRHCRFTKRREIHPFQRCHAHAEGGGGELSFLHD